MEFRTRIGFHHPTSCRARVVSFSTSAERGNDMHEQHIAGMLKALNPVLKNKSKAKSALEKYWRNRMAIVWEIKDVHTAANERERALTNEEAREILRELHKNHNAQYGIKWEDLIALIEQSVCGRKLNKSELKRFIEQNIITKN
jgi:hypothetical protein